MQSGNGKTHAWVLEFAARQPSHLEPIMGWTASADTLQQVQLHFAQLEEAVAYAQKQGWLCSVERPKKTALHPKCYEDNFAFDRPVPWTH